MTPWLAAPLPCYSKIKETKIAGQNGSKWFRYFQHKTVKNKMDAEGHFYPFLPQPPIHQQSTFGGFFGFARQVLRSGRRSVRRKRRRERSWRPCWTTCEANSLTTAGMKDVEEVPFMSTTPICSIHSRISLKRIDLCVCVCVCPSTTGEPQ